jgi:hypothetical protein
MGFHLEAIRNGSSIALNLQSILLRADIRFTPFGVRSESVSQAERGRLFYSVRRAQPLMGFRILLQQALVAEQRGYLSLEITTGTGILILLQICQFQET